MTDQTAPQTPLPLIAGYAVRLIQTDWDIWTANPLFEAITFHLAGGPGGKDAYVSISSYLYR